jgi:large subunit ribosomal protein L17
MTEATANNAPPDTGDQQDDAGATDGSAAQTGSESPEEGAAAEDAAEDAVVESGDPGDATG